MSACFIWLLSVPRPRNVVGIWLATDLSYFFFPNDMAFIGTVGLGLMP